MTEITIADMLQCVEREIGMRERVYPRWVEQKKMTAATMEKELSRMREVRNTLAKVAAYQQVFSQLVAEGVLSETDLQDRSDGVHNK